MHLPNHRGNGFAYEVVLLSGDSRWLPRWDCNDFDDMWFTEEEFEILEELAVTLYDATTFYKHRAEGETHNTFAYARGISR